MRCLTIRLTAWPRKADGECLEVRKHGYSFANCVTLRESKASVARKHQINPSFDTLGSGDDGGDLTRAESARENTRGCLMEFLLWGAQRLFRGIEQWDTG